MSAFGISSEEYVAAVEQIDGVHTHNLVYLFCPVLNSPVSARCTLIKKDLHNRCSGVCRLLIKRSCCTFALVDEQRFSPEKVWSTQLVLCCPDSPSLMWAAFCWSQQRSACFLVETSVRLHRGTQSCNKETHWSVCVPCIVKHDQCFIRFDIR